MAASRRLSAVCSQLFSCVDTVDSVSLLTCGGIGVLSDKAEFETPTAHRLEGKVAIITGAGSGIGRSTAMLFALHGAKLVLTDINEANVKETESLIKRRVSSAQVRVLSGDVSLEQHHVDTLALADQSYGRLDIYFGNAGYVGLLKDLCATKLSEFERVFKINVYGVFLGMKHSSKYMLEKGIRGSIFVTSSVAGLRAGAGSIDYSASKGAVTNMIQVAANDLYGTGIRVNGIGPGLIETGMTSTLFVQARKRGTEAKIGSLNPTCRPGFTGEIANVALFLASDDSSYVNGQVIYADGGVSTSLPFVVGTAQKYKPKTQ